MSTVSINRVEVLNNPAPFQSPFAFEIEYECFSALQDDLEWKMIYVGSAESEKYDQVLDSVLVGPVYQGQYKFVFEANPPDPSKLSQEDIVGLTVILLTCSYKGKEFIRVGYYLNNEYEDPELKENPPASPLLDKLTRSILATDPRVTRFPADFDAEPTPAMGQDGQDGSPMDGTNGWRDSSMEADMDMAGGQQPPQQQQQDANGYTGAQAAQAAGAAGEQDMMMQG